MSGGIKKAKLALIRSYGLPDRFLSLTSRLPSGDLFYQLDMFKRSGMLWLLQRGFGLSILSSPKIFQRKFSEVKAFVESIEASLKYFGINDIAKRREIIFRRVNTQGKRMEFARDLERITTVFKVAGLEFRDEDRETILADIGAPPRKHPLHHSLNRLMTRLSREKPEERDKVYDAFNLSPSRRKALSLLSDPQMVMPVICMQEETFNARLRTYQEGIDLSLTGRDGQPITEHFTFTDKEHLFDVVMEVPAKTLRGRIIDLRRQGLVLLSVKRLREHGTSGLGPAPVPARNHCAAGRQAVLRDDYDQAMRYFSQAVVLAKDDPKILLEARTGLKYSQLLQNAGIARDSRDIVRAISVYEEAMAVIVGGNIRAVHFHIIEKVIACFENVHSQPFRAEIDRKTGRSEGTEYPLWERNLLAGEIPELAASDLNETARLANDLILNPPSLEALKPQIKADLIYKALGIIANSCEGEEKNNFPVIFAMHCLFKHHFRFESYPGVVDKAREIIDILHEKGLSAFDSAHVPDILAEFSMVRLCFHMCLFVAAEIPPTAARIDKYYSVEYTLEYLAENRFKRLLSNLHHLLLTDLLMQRGIVSIPARLTRYYYPSAFLRRVLLYENAGLPFKSDYFWRLETSDDNIALHISTEQQRRDRASFISEIIPGAPASFVRGFSLQRLKDVLSIVDEYGLRFLVEAGHLFSWMDKNKEAIHEAFGKIKKKVELTRKILALYGFPEQEIDGIIASSYRELSWNNLITLNEMCKMYSRAGLDPRRAAARILNLYKEKYPRAVFHFDKAIANAIREDITLIAEEEPAPEPLRVDLKRLEYDLSEFWRLEAGRQQPLTEDDQLNLIRLAKGGDVAARDRVVKANLKIIPLLIKKIPIGRRGYKLYEKHPAYLDAIQVGNIALIEAIDSYPGTGDFMEHLTACVKEALEKEMPKLRLSYGFTERTKLLLGIDKK